MQGPDAAEFLNRVYVNGFAKLPVGKVRYGVMLNDDGIVLDDGTTARISDTQFYMTTTTAQAGEVMSWLEYLLQCHWTELNVQVASLTDEWAGMAVSGPKAREALQLAFPEADLSERGAALYGLPGHRGSRASRCGCSACPSRASWPMRSTSRPIMRSACGSIS
jgi:methylglutamate dehydrogenase subunit C